MSGLTSVTPRTRNGFCLPARRAQRVSSFDTMRTTCLDLRFVTHNVRCRSRRAQRVFFSVASRAAMSYRCHTDVLPMYCRCLADVVLMLTSRPMSCRCLVVDVASMSSRCLADVLPMSFRCHPDVLQMSCRCLGDVLAMSWRCLADVLSNDVIVDCVCGRAGADRRVTWRGPPSDSAKLLCD